MKFSAIVLVSLFSLSAFSQDYVCKPAYEKQILKLNKTLKNGRNYGSKALFVSWLTEALAFNTTIVAGSLVIYTPVTIVAAVGGMGWLQFQDMKSEAYLASQSIIEESLTDQEAVVEQKIQAYKAYQQSLAEGKLAKINEKLMKKGQPEMTMETYVSEYPVKISSSSKFTTPIMTLTANLNKKRSQLVTYKKVAEAIRALSQDDSFCPNGKVLGKRQLQKLVSSKI